MIRICLILTPIGRRSVEDICDNSTFCSGELRRFENLDQVEDFLVKREQSAT